MKKIFLFILLPIFCFPQFKAGRYIIKQAISNYSVQQDPTYPQVVLIESACADYKVNCNRQIFDFIDRGGFFFIKLANQNLFLTLMGNGDYDYTVNLKPRNPRALENKQLFHIIDNGNGSFYIQPKLENNANYYIGTRMDLYPNNGSELKFLVKDETHLPREFNDFRNASWTFFPIPVDLRTTPTKVLDKPNPSKVFVNGPNTLQIDFVTGDDNLEPKRTQENLEIRLIINNHADIILKDANQNTTWSNRSTHNVKFDIPEGIAFSDLREIHLYRMPKNDGVKYIWDVPEKDNWNLKKLTLTAKFYVNGILKTKRASFVSPLGESSHNLFRFIYEGGDGITEGNVLKIKYSFSDN